jgi:hypothetical protein
LRTAAAVRPAAAPSPFALDEDGAYRSWRDRKLLAAEAAHDDAIVEVLDPRHLSPAERAAIAQRLRGSNWAVYAGPAHIDGEQAARAVGMQFGLRRLDRNLLAGGDGISRITAAGPGSPGDRGDFIPYTNRAIRWHTDGYYNPPERRVWSLILHCVRGAAQGGGNALLDHEIAYLHLRDLAPELVHALMAADAMTIPPREDDTGVARAAQTGPVFHVDPASGRLHMRYTARTRSIEWKADAPTRSAVAALEDLMGSRSPHIRRLALQPGMGLICRNVLHDRSAFVDEPGAQRLVLRARYYDQIEAV